MSSQLAKPWWGLTSGEAVAVLAEPVRRRVRDQHHLRLNRVSNAIFTKCVHRDSTNTSPDDYP
jgi:hypothetical protein